MLDELVDLFLIEATKFNVLPLDDRSLERFNAELAGRPQLVTRSATSSGAPHRRRSANDSAVLRHSKRGDDGTVVAHRRRNHLDGDDVEAVDRDVVEREARTLRGKGRFGRPHVIARIDQVPMRSRRVEVQVAQQYSWSRPVPKCARERSELNRRLCGKMAERGRMMLEMRRGDAEPLPVELGRRKDCAPGFAGTRPRKLQEFDVVQRT
jgi:hypothetical protein